MNSHVILNWRSTWQPGPQRRESAVTRKSHYPQHRQGRAAERKSHVEVRRVPHDQAPGQGRWPPLFDLLSHLPRDRHHRVSEQDTLEAAQHIQSRVATGDQSL